MNKKYQVIIVGAGHAGIEASHICAKLGLSTNLITLKDAKIGHMPCNPAIGGPAKGTVVREIDALGGFMGIAADKTALQIKMLNLSKGPGVWSMRVQSDMNAYSDYAKNFLENLKNLTITYDKVTNLIIENNIIKGVAVENGNTILADAVILTTGTYMKAKILRGNDNFSSGPDGASTTSALSIKLKELGFELIRLKTGTPPRIKFASIDFSKAKLEPGHDKNLTFSYTTKKAISFKEQLPCYLTYTNKETHKILLDNLNKSPMYSGAIEGNGPRYCPSVEDKINRFKDKERHQIFIEPISNSSDLVYIQGLSTSMPIEVQDQVVRSIPAFKNCEIAKWGYAIEYDALNPLQLKPTLETKKITNLYTAGQINGTSGYEEAACQGLMAGINAANKILKRAPLILRRDQAYIGVLIDDLVTKGTDEPYRLLTSRSEYRLLLRHDNADQRLTKIGFDNQIISQERYNIFLTKIKDINELTIMLSNIRFGIKDKIQEDFITNNLTPLHQGVSAIDLLKRPKINFNFLSKHLNLSKKFDIDVIEAVEINVKYEGYLLKQHKQAQKYISLENKKIPLKLEYNNINNLSLEAREKLNMIKPLTIGQAYRISGINPADIEMLLIYLKKNFLKLKNL